MTRRGPDHTVVRQGHIHVEGVSWMQRKPGFLRAYISTEQKRPAAVGVIDREVVVHLSARDPATEGTTLRFRDGEDGTEFTLVKFRLPPCLPWMEWTGFVEPDKWGAMVYAYTERPYKYRDFRYKVIQRMKKAG